MQTYQTSVLVGNLTTGNYFPSLVSSSGTGNKPLNVSGSYIFDTANAKLALGNLAATYDVAASTFTGSLTTAAQPNVTSLGTLTGLGVNGTITASAITANTGVFTGDAGGLSNVVGANVTGSVPSATSATTVTQPAQANITSVGTLSALSVTGNASAGNVLGTGGVFTYVAGDGANLSAITGANVTGAVAYATTANAVAGANVSGQVTFAGTANAVAGANVSGEVTFAATANAVAGANVSGEVTFAATANAVAGANVSGTVALATTAGTVTTAAQPNITSTGTLTSLTVSGALDVLAGTLTADTLTTGASGTAGVITGNWSLSSGSRLSATYADLAEYYKGEKAYEAGTVVCFGGSAEVHISEEKCSRRVAGVVSTNPAYLMNSTCSGIPVAVALQGRVPTKVTGTCEKGDVMVSDGLGGATAWYHVATQMLPGVVIGKSIVDKDTTEMSTIEIAVGRL